MKGVGVCKYGCCTVQHRLGVGQDGAQVRMYVSLSVCMCWLLYCVQVAWSCAVSVVKQVSEVVARMVARLRPSHPDKKIQCMHSSLARSSPVVHSSTRRPERFWAERYQEDVVSLMPRFKPQELANVLWAMAVLNMKLPRWGGGGHLRVCLNMCLWAVSCGRQGKAWMRLQSGRKWFWRASSHLMFGNVAVTIHDDGCAQALMKQPQVIVGWDAAP